MTRKFLLLVALGILWTSSAHGSLIQISSATSLSNDGGFGSAVINTSDSFVRVGSSSTFVSATSTYSAVIPFDYSAGLADATGVGWFPDVTNLTAAVFDPTTG